MLKRLVLALALCAAACTSTRHSVAPPACDVSAADRAWIERALAAWRLSRAEITGIDVAGDVGAVFFDAGCVLSSDNALSDPDGQGVTWSAAPHQGAIPLPNGDAMPPVVTSFASVEDGTAFFVMSTPSVWRAGGVVGDPLDLETLMVFVLLHEAAHVAQAQTYGVQVGALAEREGLPEDFNDDSLQDRFGEDAAFASSVQREIALFLEAAFAPDDETAFARAREARALMQARAGRYFVGEDAYFSEAEALWLTFEGSGQWAGYRWLIHPRGMHLAPELAVRAANRSRWWSQNEGLAIALALDRIGPADWRDVAFGDGSQTLLQLLDASVAG